MSATTASPWRLVKVGVRYCLTHDGVANEDDYACDFARSDADWLGDDPKGCRFRELYRKVRR